MKLKRSTAIPPVRCIPRIFELSLRFISRLIQSLISFRLRLRILLKLPVGIELTTTSAVAVDPKRRPSNSRAMHASIVTVPVLFLTSNSCAKVCRFVNDTILRKHYRSPNPDLRHFSSLIRREVGQLQDTTKIWKSMINFVIL